ncbi:MAG: helix-hairpin-helix domain-containing protein [Candidatus Aadella gelida]|nr:helix-hairpin-helix domain-containing protein [Candidatus Aadella gelida]
MNGRKYEQIFLGILIFVLLIGAGFLYCRNSSQFKNITVERDEPGTIQEILKEINDKRRVNVNKAEVGELTDISGIGKVLARRIFDYRKTYGNINNEDEMLEIKGIGKKKLDEIRSRVSF